MPVLPRVLLAQMCDLPEAWRARLRELSFGAYNGTMWRWTYHRAACWVAIGFRRHPPERGYGPEDILGWACWTENEEPHPVMGAYVEEASRKAGYARQLADALLRHHRHRRPPGSIVIAVSGYWPAWPAIIEAAGFTHQNWD